MKPEDTGRTEGWVRTHQDTVHCLQSRWKIVNTDPLISLRYREQLCPRLSPKVPKNCGAAWMACSDQAVLTHCIQPAVPLQKVNRQKRGKSPMRCFGADTPARKSYGVPCVPGGCRCTELPVPFPPFLTDLLMSSEYSASGRLLALAWGSTEFSGPRSHCHKHQIQHVFTRRPMHK